MLIEPLYELQMLDPATPSFITFPKTYIGEKEALLEVASNLLRAENYIDTANAIREYFNGNTEVKHYVGFQEMSLLRPVQVLEKTEMHVAEREWEHMNVWDCPCHMRFRSAEVAQLLIKRERVFSRFIQAKFTDLQYLGFEDRWQPIGNLIFGNDAVINITQRGDGSIELCNLLYVVEEGSESLKKQQKKMYDPDSLIFDKICDEIFGDG